MKYAVWGDYNCVSECKLFESDNFEEARAWADNYVRWGDTGGYWSIEVSSRAADGSLLVHYCLEDLGVEDDYCLDDGA